MSTHPPTRVDDGPDDPALALKTSPTKVREPWTRKRRNVTIGAGAVVAIVLCVGGAFGLTAMGAQAEQQSAVDAVKAAVHTLAVSEISNQAAKVDLDTAITATTQLNAGVAPVTAAAPAYLDVAATAVLEQSRVALGAAVTTVKSPDPEHPDQPAASDTMPASTVDRMLPKDPTMVAAKTMSARLAAATATVDEDTTAKRHAIDVLTAAHKPVAAALRDVGNAVVTTNAPAVRAAAPAVDPGTLTAFEGAVTALQAAIDDTDPLIPALNAYTAAAKTVLDAQTAINTQAAIDAANADTYVDPSTGESKPNPNYNGDNSGNGNDSGSDGGGGSGSGSGGGDSGGGSGGGGGTPAPTPPRIVYGSSSCSGDSGYAVSSYGNRTIGVPGSGVASINGPYDNGSGWQVDWTCG